MGLNWAEHTVEIAAPIETCFAAITDYETFPAWQSAVVDTEVLDWDKKGRGKRVRLFVDAKVRKVDYTLDYSYDEPERIEWDFVEGNGINDADGHYLFEDLGDRTRATYKLGLEVGIPLPGPVARRAHRSTLKASVEDLKREAERRAGGERPAVEREMSAPRGTHRQPGLRGFDPRGRRRRRLLSRQPRHGDRLEDRRQAGAPRDRAGHRRGGLRHEPRRSSARTGLGRLAGYRASSRVAARLSAARDR